MSKPVTSQLFKLFFGGIDVFFDGRLLELLGFEILLGFDLDRRGLLLLFIGLFPFRVCFLLVLGRVLLQLELEFDAIRLELGLRDDGRIGVDRLLLF